MLDKMDERRNWKSINTEEGKAKYRKLNNELRRETDSAKRQWWNIKCKELEELDRKGRSDLDLLCASVRQLTWKNTSKTKGIATIRDSEGNMITEAEQVRKRWKEYIEILYDKSGKPVENEMGVENECAVEEDCKGPGCWIVKLDQQFKK